MQTDRQKEIIAASIVLIDEKGIQGLTIKNLAFAIGVSEPAIYRHFKNKIEILISILDFFNSEIKEMLIGVLEGTGTSIFKIEQLYKKHFQKFQHMPSLVSVIFSEELFRNEKILMEKIAGIIDQNNKALNAIIVEGQGKNEIRSDIPAMELSVITIGTLRMFVKRWQMSRYSFDLMEQGEGIINSMKQILKPI